MKIKILTIALLLFTYTAYCGAGIWGSDITIMKNSSTINYKGNSGTSGSGSVNFDGSYLGIFNSFSGNLLLKGGFIETWKNNGNVCSGTLFYLVYPSGNRPTSPTFSTINLSTECDCSSNSFSCVATSSCSNNGTDQAWINVSSSIDLTAFTTGNYVIEVYFTATGNSSGTNGCSENFYDSQSAGINYTATFTLTTGLAVNFLGLNGNLKNNQAILNWSVTPNSEITGFCIEHSSDGVNFNSAGDYNGNMQLSSFTQAANLIFYGNNFYRIQVKTNTQLKYYSNIINIVNNNENDAIKIYPNPVINKVLTISFSQFKADTYFISLYTPNGKNIYNQLLNYSGYTKQYTLNLEKIVEKGAILLNIKSTTQQFKSWLIIK